ncbi:MAG TPA: metallophosphoesterase, partial [Candidatus Berkiella sp.]|nr:metallophosphoesterase [Candidatus Berkiella sp.]
MSTYAIGDVQGCFSQLEALLEMIHYDHTQDTLWFTGDLINRGPESLRTLRFIRELPDNTICVLGNHDLTLLAASVGAILPQHGDTYEEILHAPDQESLVNWLKNRPLMH